MSDRQIHAVILAGGSRLWPLSRQHLPKQFLSPDGDASLLQTAIKRLSPAISAENILIVTQEAHAKGEARALLPCRALYEIGAEDFCNIETADAVLISKNDQTQRVREAADTLDQRGATEHVYHAKVNRPWGSNTVLEEDSEGFKIKRMEVAPGARLSLQSHSRRSEHWVAVCGTATVTNGGEVITVQKNQSTYIPIGARHRLENLGAEPLHLVEIQVGDYLGEDDIQRYEDNYGR